MHICKSRLMPLYLSYWIILDTTPTLWVPEFFPLSFTRPRGEVFENTSFEFVWALRQSQGFYYIYF